MLTDVEYNMCCLIVNQQYCFYQHRITGQIASSSLVYIVSEVYYVLYNETTLDALVLTVHEVKSHSIFVLEQNKTTMALGNVLIQFNQNEACAESIKRRYVRY